MNVSTSAPVTVEVIHRTPEGKELYRSIETYLKSDLYCPTCGKQEVFMDQREELPTVNRFVCRACGADFGALTSLIGPDANGPEHFGNQVIAALRAAKP